LIITSNKIHATGAAQFYPPKGTVEITNGKSASYFYHFLLARQ